MNNKIFLIYKPFFSCARLFFRSTTNNQIVKNASQNNQIRKNVSQKVFSERIIFDIRNIESIWRRSKDRNSFNNHLYHCCLNNSELVTYATDMIKCASSRNSISSSFVFDIIEAFSNYIEENKIPFKPTVDQNIDVLSSILNFKNYQLVQLACNILRLHDQPLKYRTFIKDLMGDQKFVEAALLVSALQLQNEFDVKEILLSLLLEGNIKIASKYMANYPDMQLKVVKYLDEFLLKTNLPTPSTYLHSRPRKVLKTLSSLISMYKISLDNCPNLQFIRSKGAINILIHRRKQQSVSETTWEEMIKNIVRDDEDLKRYLIHKLMLNKDKMTALKMAEVFNVQDQDLFSETCEIIAGSEHDLSEDLEASSDTLENFEIYDISDEYLKFSLKAEDIKVINNKEKFINCIDEIQNYNMIGIDSEWKPNLGLSVDRLSLIQLAVHDKVYVIDVFVLSKILKSEDWDMLLDNIFGNPKIIKLGCAIMSDVNMILESIKGTKGKAVKFSHILDMALLYLKLQEVYPIEMKYTGDKNFTRGLSSMCEVILGKPLNKEDRLCDWEKRPLTESQIEYAALDAHCLLQIYDKLKEESIEKNMNFEHMAKVAIVLTTSQWKPKRKFKGVKSGQAFEVHTLIPIGQLKVVVDPMFESQGRELRKLGADVIILEGQDVADKAVEISKREGRVIACSRKLYSQIKLRVKEGFCYYFTSDERQIKVAHFLQHFNAQVSTESIFSRCVNCNSNHGMKLSGDDLETLHDLHKTNADRSIKCLLGENLNSFSSELQIILKEIMNSDIDIEFSTHDISISSNDYAFLCKECGHVS